MSEEMRAEEDVVVQSKPSKSNSVLRRIGLYAALMLIAFLVGFVPMWLKARESGNQLAATERTLALAQLQNQIASAALDARKGDCEPARQAASQFYTSLQSDIGKGDASPLTPAQQQAAQALFAGRDEIITLLARSDPAAADRLSEVYAAYRKLVGG